jgi:hypothetical protein
LGREVNVRRSARVKLGGSAMARLVCIECQAESEPFRVALVEEEGDNLYYPSPKTFPAGWEVDDEEELWNGMIFGLCPKCKEEV